LTGEAAIVGVEQLTGISAAQEDALAIQGNGDSFTIQVANDQLSGGTFLGGSQANRLPSAAWHRMCLLK
jgi:hypothetical protein